MFYLVLPSNSSFEYYPENTVAHYHTHLPKEISLSGDWEVGLQEIQYTRNWSSFEEGSTAGFLYVDGPPTGVSSECIIKNLPNGYYSNKGEVLQAIVQELSQDVQNVADKVQMNWNPKSNVASITVAEHFVLHPNSYLRKMLGFRPHDNTPFIDGTFLSRRRDYLNQQCTALYVYCDIVRPRVVGDSLVNLLRTVPVTGAQGDVVYHSFQHVQYIPLANLNFDTIEIDIRDDTGKRVSFEGGRVVTTLHFRRKKTPQLID